MNAPSQEQLISTKEAGEISGYHADYLARLARSGKLGGKRIGRNWVINKDSLTSFLKEQSTHKANAARALAQVRGAEYKAANASLATVARRVKRVREVHPVGYYAAMGAVEIPIHKLSGSFRDQALSLVVATLVVGFGVAASTSPFIPAVGNTIAYSAFAVVETFSETLEEVPEKFNKNVAAAGDNISAQVENARGLAGVSAVPLAGDLPLTRMVSSSYPTEAHVPVYQEIVDEPIVSRADVTASAHGIVELAVHPVRIPGVLVGAYFGIGESAYGVILDSLDAYRSLIEATGDHALAYASQVRDDIKGAPNAFVGIAHALIHAEVSLAYALAEAGPSSARGITALIGNTGDALARGTSHVPGLATGAFLGATGAPAYVAPAIAQAIFNIEYGVSKEAVAMVTSFPANVRDGYLGTLGKTAAAVEGLTSGKSVALATYNAISGLFGGVVDALSFFFAEPPIVVVANDGIQTHTTPAPSVPAATTPVSSGSSGSASNTPPANSGSSDTIPPVVTLNGDAALELTQGDTFTDPGATATDEGSQTSNSGPGSLTSSIVVTGSVDASTPGLYSLTYTATDAGGNTGSASRLVTVLPLPLAPELTEP